jgi:hypothetical protein
MATYHVFRVSEYLRRGEPIKIDADSDAEAIRKAEQYLDGVDLLVRTNRRLSAASSSQSDEQRDGLWRLQRRDSTIPVWLEAVADRGQRELSL